MTINPKSLFEQQELLHKEARQLPPWAVNALRWGAQKLQQGARRVHEGAQRSSQRIKGTLQPVAELADDVGGRMADKPIPKDVATVNKVLNPSGTGTLSAAKVIGPTEALLTGQPRIMTQAYIDAVANRQALLAELIDPQTTRSLDTIRRELATANDTIKTLATHLRKLDKNQVAPVFREANRGVNQTTNAARAAGRVDDTFINARNGKELTSAEIAALKATPAGSALGSSPLFSNVQDAISRNVDDMYATFGHNFKLDPRWRDFMSAAFGHGSGVVTGPAKALYGGLLRPLGLGTKAYGKSLWNYPVRTLAATAGTAGGAAVLDKAEGGTVSTLAEKALNDALGFDPHAAEWAQLNADRAARAQSDNGGVVGAVAGADGELEDTTDGGDPTPDKDTGPSVFQDLGEIASDPKTVFTDDKHRLNPKNNLLTALATGGLGGLTGGLVGYGIHDALSNNSDEGARKRRFRNWTLGGTGLGLAGALAYNMMNKPTTTTTGTPPATPPATPTTPPTTPTP